MKIKKIQLTKMSTLSVTYKDDDGNIVTLEGANIVHKDLKEALRALIPHFALLCEMRETTDKTLKELEEQKELTNGGIYNNLMVTGIVLGDDEVQCQIIGRRILRRGDIINVNSPRLSLVDDDEYGYLSDLSLAVDGLKYEASEYIEERKWGIKEAQLTFDDAGDPFNGEVKAGDVPETKVTMTTTRTLKRSRKSKKMEAVS